MNKALLIAILLTSGCSALNYVADGETTAEIGAGWQMHRNGYIGPQDFSHWILKHDLGEFYVKYLHQSAISAGGPFNDDEESNQDVIMVGREWVIRQGKP